MYYKGNLLNLISVIVFTSILYYYLPSYASGFFQGFGVTCAVLMSYGEVGMGFKR